MTNVAVQAGIYGCGERGQEIENLLCQFESKWPSLRDALLKAGGTVSNDHRDDIAQFLAIQRVRTREYVAQSEFLHEFAKAYERRPVAKDDIKIFLTERHLKFIPSDREIEGAWTLASYFLDRGELPGKDEMTEMHFRIALRQLGPRLTRLRWKVEHCRKPILLTCDRPVMYWRPHVPSDAYEGIGIHSAREIRLPLTPQDLLVIRSEGAEDSIEHVQPRRFEAVNLETAAQCHEFVIAPFSRPSLLKALVIAKHRPVLRFDIAPGFRENPNGSHEPMGDILHTWIPTRAAS